MFGYSMFWDSTYILVLIGAVISLIASGNVKSTYNKFSQVRSSRGVTAENAAMAILHGAGIMDVRIERIRGNLTDNYDPRSKVLHLSDTVYGSSSIAAIGVAAHECGHAIQHDRNYFPLGLRSAIVPVANIGSMLSWPVLIIGIMLGSMDLANVGILLFTCVVIFQLVTLPVEFDASNRALKILRDSNMLVGEENRGAKKVLTAAALTYVAALLTTILQLLRMILIASGGRRRD